MGMANERETVSRENWFTVGQNGEIAHTQKSMKNIKWKNIELRRIAHISDAIFFST